MAPALFVRRQQCKPRRRPLWKIMFETQESGGPRRDRVSQIMLETFNVIAMNMAIKVESA